MIEIRFDKTKDEVALLIWFLVDHSVVGCVWGIGERKWVGEFGRRMMMFESVLMYGAEIWGWKEQEDVERVQEKYLR
jgi:hypothetical protein